MSAPSDDKIVHAPHDPLTEYYADENARSGFLRGIFDRTAPHYDRIESILAFGSGPWYRRQALLRAGLSSGMRIVDVGVGTGLVAREAVQVTGDARLVVGVDPSPGMMANADLPEGVQLVEGRAESIPFPDASFDMLSMGYALRHISDLSVAFHEFFRVLKPGGRLCMLEITRPGHIWSRALMKVYMRGIVPVLARAAGGGAETSRLWRYYWDTIDACAPHEQVVATLKEAGFSDARRHIAHAPLPMLAEYQAVKPA
ncbi:MAG: class I SAM-dependent methyltransferase [Rhodocyclaceae bacterium]|nr:class I SAM-dependent methyltransferase [Rhodocyclaceae bacterium]